VRQIFAWAADGEGLSTIVRKLNERGVPTPSVYALATGKIKNEKQVGSGVWQTRTLAVILADDVYAGDMTQGKTATVRRGRAQNKDKSEWLTVRNTHEPILNRALFEKVQKIRADVKTESKRRKVQPYTENIFKGKIFCAACGGMLNRGRDEKRPPDKQYYFYCLSKYRNKKDSCAGVYMSEADLRAVVSEILCKHAEALSDGGASCLDAGLEASRASLKKEAAALNASISQNEGFAKSLYENLAVGVINQADYFSLKADYERKISEARERLAACESELRGLNEKSPQMRGFAEVLRSVRPAADLTRALVETLIERIDVSPDHSIQITFAFADEFVDYASAETEAVVNG
jgi:hypothetical protein